MKIFISHSQKDEKLAKELKKILEMPKKMDVFIFEKKKLFGKPIDKKITNELDHSDYLVAIITANSTNSSSVNQEMGYAQAKSIEKIPMVETGSEKGFLLHGTENVEFTKKNFKSKCIEVRNYILKNGPKRLFTEEEEIEIRKSAHYRYAVRHHILFFLGGMFYRLNMGDEAQRHELFYGIEPQWDKNGNLDQLRDFFKQDEDKLIEHFSKIEFSMYGKIHMEYDLLVNEFKQANRFPNHILPDKESDLVVELQEYIRNEPSETFDLKKHVRHWMKLDPEDNNCSKILNSKDRHTRLQIRQTLRFIIRDLEELYEILINLLKIYVIYQNKFGDIAFKRSS